MLNDAEKEIFLKYKNALVAIGLDLTDDTVIDYIAGCNHNLEPKFQAIISYWYWLQNQGRAIGNANQLLVQSFSQEWTPMEWSDEFLNHPSFKSSASKWWSEASQIEVLKNLIVDVQDNFWSGGRVVFSYPDGETWTMDLERVMDMSWQQIIAHYQRVTDTVIEIHPGSFIIHSKASINQS